MQYTRTILTLTIVIFSFGTSNLTAQTCTAGMAGIYPCNTIDLLSTMSTTALSPNGTSPSGNDIWGWTGASGKEYAIVGLTDGTAFVDVSVPTSPVLVGHLATASVSSAWRDIKVVGNYAYIGSEAGSHNMQVFDLTRLESATGLPVTFTADGSATIGTGGRSHNVFADPEAGYIGACGGNVPVGGMAFYDIGSPTSPTLAGNFDAPAGVNDYTHDAVCVIYRGADADHIGKQICFGFNANIMVAVDVTDKSNPVLIGTMQYTPIGYTHQGWISDDHLYIYLNDETDERNFGINTRTQIIDIADLEDMTPLAPYNSALATIDHNLYIKGNYMYQANYEAGLRILDIQDKTAPVEVASFDVYPTSNNSNFNGAWSVYPYFKSGTIVVNSIQGGLFVLQPNLPFYAMEHTGAGIQTITQGQNAVFNIDLTAYSGFSDAVTLTVSGEPTGALGTPVLTGGADGAAVVTVTTSASTPTGKYQLLLTGNAGMTSEEQLSMALIVNAVLPVELTDFSAVAQQETIQLRWQTAAEYQNKGFFIERATLPQTGDFERIAWVAAKGNGSSTTNYFYEDRAVEKGITYYYRLRQTDIDGQEELSEIVQATIYKLAQMIDIYPNPASRFLTVKMSGMDIKRNFSIHIINVNGQIVEQQKWTDLPADHILTINTESLNRGIYTLQIIADDEQFTRRLVLN